jgi:hypothetical protein
VRCSLFIFTQEFVLSLKLNIKKIISFSLYGTDSVYVHGAFENAKLALEIFPEWQTRFYVDEQTDTDILNQLRDLRSEVLIRPKNVGISGRFWRFEPLFEENTILLSRDVDSRLSMREKVAVDYWLESGKKFHIIRDHPMHVAKILGGLFGSINDAKFLRVYRIFKSFTRMSNYGDDQYFLSRVIYPLIKNDVLIHSSGVFYDDEIIRKVDYSKLDFEFMGCGFKKENSLIPHVDVVKNLKTTKREKAQVLYYRLKSMLDSL